MKETVVERKNRATVFYLTFPPVVDIMKGQRSKKCRKTKEKIKC